MRSILVISLALLAACGGPTQNPVDTSTPDTISVPDAGTPDVITTPDTLVPDTTPIDTTPGIDTTPTPDTTPAIDTTPGAEVQVNPCATVTCGTHGTCSAGACVCSQDWYGPKCNFDASQFSANKVFCPSDSGKLEISGATGTEAYLNGYYVDVPVGAVDRCALFFLSPALGVNLPAPTTGKIVPVAHGIEVTAVDKDAPLLADGSLNKVTLLQEVGVFFNNNRGSVQLFDSNAFTSLATTIVQTGTLGKTKHFSPFYLDVDNPVVVASASHVGNREVLIDFSGTVHAGSTTPYLLQFAAAEGGTLLTLTAADSTGLKFKTTLAGGTHVLSATVADQYGDVGTKQVSLTVDLCSTVTCQPYQTCRATDGVCVGSDPCAPNPCVHGTCSSATGSAVCTSCADGWTGTLCDVQDLCFGKSCSSHGTCNASNGVCKCDSGWMGSSCESDDPCLPNPCGNGGTCSVSGTSAVCACTGHWNSATSCATCTGHWDQTTSCTSCASGWTGSDCNTVVVVDPCAGVTCSNHGTCGAGICSCSTGYTGSACNSCATGYQGYPTCVPIPPPAPTITGLGIDCSGGIVPGYCGGGETFPVSWGFTNATSFTTSLTKVSGCTSTNGALSPSSGTLVGSSNTISYTLGDCAPSTVRITVTVTGPGGSASASINVDYY